MKSFITTGGSEWRQHATRLLLAVVTTAVIVWALPREERSTYHYEEGKPWMYGSFIATFDFPVYKTEAAMQAQEDSLLALFVPYYDIDTTAASAQTARLAAACASAEAAVAQQYIDTAAARLRAVYAAGIMEASLYDELSADTAATLRLVAGGNARTVGIGEVFSALTAYEYVMQGLTGETRTALQRLDISHYIEPNLSYDETRNAAEQAEIVRSIPSASGMVMSGQKIIDRGDIVDEYTCRVLDSFEKETRRRGDTSDNTWCLLLGQLLFTAILVTLFSTYLFLFRRDYLDNTRSLSMAYALITLFCVLTALFMRHNILSVYILPYALVPVFVRVFMDSRTAFIVHTVTILICTTAVNYPYQFAIVQLIAGLVAIYSLRELVRRTQILRTALFVTLACALSYGALQLTQSTDTLLFDRDMYIHFVVGGLLLLLAYPLMSLVETLFGFTSNITLFELSNTSRGLAHDLSMAAPGTFQHSVSVGNLAAEVANRIGADSLLVRTAALYHDIGKMTNPAYYTENQAGINPHDSLSYMESAQMVVSHVTEGVRLAEKHNLPSILKDFILTHHGAGMAKYFYVKYKNEHPDEDVDTEAFSYPGPNPFTLEQAILMMADAVEAASRSLPEYTEESISQLVNKIVDGQVADGFFRECPITFRDIAQTKQVLIDRLRTIYHTRVSYPELNKQARRHERHRHR